MSNIEDLKAELLYCQEQYRIAKDNLGLCKESLKKAQIEFRIEEVKRTLKGMRTLISLGAMNEHEFDNYIVHCLNCLNGNIDGGVISIDKDIEKAQAESEGEGMTREELKEHCLEQIEMCEVSAKCKGEKPSGKLYEEHKLILELLEQEPNTKNDLGVNCISRKAVLDITWQDPSYTDPLNVLTEVRDKVRELPSVTLQPREDAVSRKEVLNQIFYSTDNSGDVVLGSALRERIERLPSVIPEPRWIPDSERLPEESGNYLITYCDGDKIETQEAVYFEDEDECKWFDTTDVEITLAVTAWMPLPEPYKTESEDQE